LLRHEIFPAYLYRRGFFHIFNTLKSPPIKMKIATLLLLATGFLTAVLGRVSEHIHPEHSAPSKRNARSLSRSLSTPADALLGNSTSSPGSSTLVARALFDANNVATDAMFEKQRAKGHFLGCLLVATDEAAGKGWPDPYGRTPKSAKSIWTGTLQG
jgi:hypothetical protein